MIIFKNKLDFKIIHTLISFFSLFSLLRFYVCNNIYTNDYLDPLTLTFKNPKTIQMFNIIILYHYVMSFLIAITIFTFIFVFLSFFRSYWFFTIRIKSKPSKYSNVIEVFEKAHPTLWLDEVLLYIRTYLIKQKKKNLDFYKKDLKKSLKDQITHAPLLEFLWVVFPALILVAIAYPSIIMLYYNESYVEPVFNITVIGNQWYWTYEYNDFNLVEIFKKHITNKRTNLTGCLNDLVMGAYGFRADLKQSNEEFLILEEFDKYLISLIPTRLSVDCNMIIAKDPKFLRLLTTDQCLVLPSKTPIRLMVTSNDVIHSWAVPSYGVKLDAVPGRINQQIINIPLQGTSWGQCSELCGVNHAFMPIEVKVLSLTDFLFFMELRIKEVLTPFFLTYFEERVHILKNLFYQALDEQSSSTASTKSKTEYLRILFPSEKIEKIENSHFFIKDKWEKGYRIIVEGLTSPDFKAGDKRDRRAREKVLRLIIRGLSDFAYKRREK